MNAVRLLRDLSDLTQAELAEAAGTSQPTIAAYETGRKSPTLRTLRRLAKVAGLEATITFHRPMTREERRSLHLHRAIARRLERSPQLVLARARDTLSLMRGNHPEEEQLFREWEVILNRPVSELLPALIDPSPRGRELRHVRVLRAGVEALTAVIPEGWQDRPVRFQTAGTRGVVAWCLEPHDRPRAYQALIG